MISKISDDSLDQIIAQFLSGQSVARLLESNAEFGPELASLLPAVEAVQLLSPVEAPGQQALIDDRNAFLAEITAIQLQPVSTGHFARLNSWISVNLPRLIPSSWGQRKEVRKMSFIVVKALLALTVAFGSISGVIVAAENSLPGSPIYPLKLAQEEIRLALIRDPVQEAELHFDLARERAKEMIQTASHGEVPQEATANRLQTHMEEAYINAAQVSDESLESLLIQAQEMTQTQEQALIRVQEQASEQAKDRLQETARLMAQWRKIAEDGLQEPEQFRLRFRSGEAGESPGPGQPGGNSDCSGDCEPAGDQNQYGKNGNQAGQGPGPGQPGGNPDCDGDCEPVGDEYKYGQESGGPSNSAGPGEPGGNPDCSGDCEPVGDENKYGQEGNGASQGPGSSEAGGNPDCTGDCEPAGDENKYGQEGDGSSQSPGPGEPGGNPECDGDCEPAGDENKYGQDGDEASQGPGPGEPGGNPDCSNECDGSAGGSVDPTNNQQDPINGGEGGTGTSGGQSSGSQSCS